MLAGKIGPDRDNDSSETENRRRAGWRTFGVERVVMVTGGDDGSERPKVTDTEIAGLYGTGPLEAKRVAALLGRDRADRRADNRRRTAEDEIDAGKFDNIADAAVPPTREQLRHGEFEPYTADKTDGTVRTTKAMRRVQTARIVQLHDRGILTDDTYPAVLWYRKQWEATGFDTLLIASAFNERSAGGERAYGHMARTAIEAEARDQLHYAASFIPVDMLGTFDRVVLEEMTITEAARAARCRYVNVTAVVKESALRLLGGIGHLLPVRAVGAPGSAPVVEPEPVDFEVAAHEPGVVTTVDHRFLDARGYMRPWSEIQAILRGEEPNLEGAQ